MLQLNSEAAQLWNSMVVRWPWREVALGRGGSAHLHLHLCWPVLCQSAPPAVLRPAPVRLQCSSSSWGSGTLCLWWIGTVYSPSQRGEDCYTSREKFPSLVPDWFVLMQMSTPDPHRLIGPKSTALIGWNGAALIGQWRCHSYGALIRLRKLQSYWLKYNSNNFSVRAGSDGRNAVQAGSSGQEAGSSGQAFPRSAFCVKGPA